MNTPLDPDRINPDRIAQLLNISTRQLDQQTLSALSRARQAALSRQSAHTHVLGFITGRWTFGLFPQFTQPLLVAALLAIVVFGGTSYWQHAQEQQISDLDVAILTDELPIEVFVDEQS